MALRAVKPMIRSLLLSYTLSALLLALLAFALYRLRLEEGIVNLLIFAVYFAACAGGGLAAGKSMGKRRLFWGFLSGLLYFLVLFAGSRLLNQGVPLDLRRSSYVLGLCILGGTFGAVLS